MLKHLCPICKKPARVRSEVKMAGGITYVYFCGHIEQRKESFSYASRKELVNFRGIDPTPYESMVLPLRESEAYKNFSVSSFVREADAATDILNKSTEEVKPEIFELPPTVNLTEILKDDGFNSLSGAKRAYDYQISGVKFVERSNFRALIADAMGLGKTIQAALTYKRNKEELTPILFVVPASLRTQWFHELREWVEENPTSIMILMNKNYFVPGFKIYIISQDLIGKKGIKELLIPLGIKCIVIDECQDFKDGSSQRTNGLVDYITETGIEKIIALSGTPIKNRASEYFTILNLMDPTEFNSPEKFRRKYLRTNEKGQYTRLDEWMVDEFKDKTRSFIIRREKEEVLLDLPPLSRGVKFVTIDDPAVKKSYNQKLSLMQNFISNAAARDERITAIEILGWLAQLRNITGQAKCPAALEWIQEFLDTTEYSLAIGIHHNGVKDFLVPLLEMNGYPKPLVYSGSENQLQKDTAVAAFNNGANRVLLLNMKAGGRGLNLQSCHNVLQMEMTWNPADEDQFYGRFHRNGQTKPVQGTTLIAEGTIDQWFHELKADKRKMFKETVAFDSTSEEEMISNESSVSEMLFELANLTISKKL